MGGVPGVGLPSIWREGPASPMEKLRSAQVMQAGGAIISARAQFRGFGVGGRTIRSPVPRASRRRACRKSSWRNSDIAASVMNRSGTTMPHSLAHCRARCLRAARRRIGRKLVEQRTSSPSAVSRSAGAGASADAPAIRQDWRYAARGPSGGGSAATHSPAAAAAPDRSGEQNRHGGIVRHQRPVPVDGDRRIGLVALEHQIDRFARGL